MDIRLIVAIVARGKANEMVKIAKKAGAQGATIFYGRGSGSEEAKQLFNLHIEPQKEIILILIDSEKKDKVMEEMKVKGKLKNPGTGIIFSLPVSDVIGLRHRLDLN